VDWYLADLPKYLESLRDLRPPTLFAAGIAGLLLESDAVGVRHSSLPISVHVGINLASFALTKMRDGGDTVLQSLGGAVMILALGLGKMNGNS
jgi:hypothetical protein